MVLGLGYGELIMVVGVSAMLFGTKDLPKIARFGGKGVGWAVGYLQQARGHLQEMGGTSEMVKIHQEMQETMHQLRAIQDEVKRGTNILNPATTFRSPPGSIESQSPTQSGLPIDSANGIAQHPQNPSTNESVSRSLNRIEGKLQSLQGFAAGGVGVGPSSAKSTPVAGHGSLVGCLSNAVGKEPSPIPISAVSAGLTKGNAQSGSDIVMDALLEEHVASQAQAFLESEMMRK